MFLEGVELYCHNLTQSNISHQPRHLSVRTGGECHQEEWDAGHQAEYRDRVGGAGLHHPVQHVLRVRELRGNISLLAADGQR